MHSVRPTRHFATLGRIANRTDDQEEEAVKADLTHAVWYLAEFDQSLARLSGNVHPKISATVQRTVDLWQAGEKVLVFAFYRQTCRALRIHISREIERRLNTLVRRRFAGARRPIEDGEIGRVLESVQKRYFDDAKSPARKALDRALRAILDRREGDLAKVGVPPEQQEQLLEIMRRFLRVTTTLVRCFPIHGARHQGAAPSCAKHA